MDSVGVDLGRMRSQRRDRLVTEARRDGLAAVLVIGTAAVAYAGGVTVPVADVGLARRRRTAVLVPTDGSLPHVWTPWPDGAPPDLPADHVRPGLRLEDDTDAARLVAAVLDRCGAGAVVGVDDLTWPLRRALAAAGLTIADARPALARARAVKTPDEVACIRRAQWINETAMAEIAPLVTPGVRGPELTGAFLAACTRLGAAGPVVDPIWQVVPPAVGAGPRSVTGDVVFPVPTSDTPLADGDLVWVDTGVVLHGYGSDFGTTWDVGTPHPARADQWRRLRAVLDAVTAAVRPGATGRDLTRAAERAEADRRRPWLRHLYLAHGVGTAPTETPMIGTDLGEEADEALVLVPGTVVVLEPVIWDDGAGGVRAEEILLVTDSGNELLSAPAGPVAS